jgi:hypothetical protein
MKTIDEVIKQLHEVGIDQYGYEVLSVWGKTIIQECADNFECTTESVYVPGAENELQEHPVLVRDSILRVKEMIK